MSREYGSKWVIDSSWGTKGICSYRNVLNALPRRIRRLTSQYLKHRAIYVTAEVCNAAAKFFSSSFLHEDFNASSSYWSVYEFAFFRFSLPCRLVVRDIDWPGIPVMTVMYIECVLLCIHMICVSSWKMKTDAGQKFFILFPTSFNLCYEHGTTFSISFDSKFLVDFF